MINAKEVNTTASAAQSTYGISEQSHRRWSGHMADDIGCSYGPEPLAFLTATADELVLSGTRGTFRIPRVEITKIGRGKMYPWFFSAVRIHHTVKSLPQELQFKPLGEHWRKVVGALRELGYPSA